MEEEKERVAVREWRRAAAAARGCGARVLLGLGAREREEAISWGRNRINTIDRRIGCDARSRRLCVSTLVLPTYCHSVEEPGPG